MELKDCIMNRGYVKASITRISKFCDDDKQLHVASTNLLHEKKRRLSELFREYEQYNKNILVLGNADDPEDVGLIENRVDKCMELINDQIDRMSAGESSSPSPAPAAPRDFKMVPPINIRSFDGKNILDYYPFINMFKSVIHSDTKFTSCEKLYYLRSYLTGEALNLIVNLMLTDANYMVALDLLDKRYNNIPKIVSYHVNSILDLPVLTKCTAQGLRSIVDNVNMHLAALKNLEQCVEHWGTLLVNILFKKVDSYTYRGFHLECNMKEVPKLGDFLAFLEKRAVILESTSAVEEKLPRPMKSHVSSAAISQVSCKFCQESHKIFQCAKFKMLTYKEKDDFVNSNHLCRMCLNAHLGKCFLNVKYATCQQEHNTLLHSPTKSNVANVTTDNSSSQDVNKDVKLDVNSSDRPLQSSNHIANMQDTFKTQKSVLLPTAMVKLMKNDGSYTYAKALLDSGSQVSFITEKMLKQLSCNVYKSDELVMGVCENTSSVSKKADVMIRSSVSDFRLEVSCCVTKNITCPLPQQTFDISEFEIPSYVKLADRNFNRTEEISLLLGCDVFFQVLQRESLPLAPSGPFLVNTSFGYIVAGTLPVSAGKITTCNYCVTTEGNPFKFQLSHDNEKSSLLLKHEDSPTFDLENTISKFWECEKVPDLIKEATSEQKLAEQIFQESVTLENKKFTVALPLKVDLENINLGDSFDRALQRFFNLERRFLKDHELYEKYKKFIHAYIEQDHARYFDISKYDLQSGNVYFLPHHPVINPNSKTTPVRAVFDGGATTKKNISLNDILLNGPVVQNDLFDILTLFRTFKFVLLCDVKAMYRQVLIEDKYRSLQNILWRDSPTESVKCVQLQTVTYGLKSSAFLATRCLVELALRYKDKYPLASFALLHTSYVDDIQCGSNDLSEFIQMKKELIELMEIASFSLHKWCSNHTDILDDIPTELHQLGGKRFDKNNEYVKTLGLTYDVVGDTLNIQCPEKQVQDKYTKREMLSFISKFFDPLGLVGPILVQAKGLMQQVWFADITWDDYLPDILNKRWVAFAKGLIEMPSIPISRNINVQQAKSMELIGFCDAASMAHGCCLYLRIIDSENNVFVNLLCSKSRINPKNKILTTPRLELNGALLLSMLARKVQSTLSLKYTVKTYLYTDSLIVLAWLDTQPVRLNMYVGNRVEQIRKLTSDFEWYYVNTNDNPADFLSRGVEPHALAKCDLWWKGPQYLQSLDYSHENAKCKPLKDNFPELKLKTKACNIYTDINTVHNCILKYSNLDKMTKVMSYILRFVHNCKKINTVKRRGNLCPEELNSALHTIIKLDQNHHFQEELKSLKSKLPLKSNLSCLNPFIDSFGLLKVGGRLHNASLPLAQKHPIILPKGSHVTKLIILKEHLRLKHAGHTLVHSSLNEKYWIINAMREIKSVLYKCIMCFKLKAKNATQLMGSLPLDRVNMTRPFQIVGTDYAGPFHVKQTRIRNPVITKAYVVIFICFVTKAIHIELASDMTTNTFLGCLKRFIARRNKPTKIYCDNAAYYKGANNVLKEIYDLQNSTDHQNSVTNFVNSERISFHFIPSYSPVFGGLWEAGIKSIKYHMKRVLGNTVLTYEELYTVIVQIESILNSRPLTPLSRDPDNMTYLTPGHFLTGASLSSYPETDLTNVNIGRLSFWKQCVKLQQDFWKQWHKQYLVLLQSRPKWRNESPNLKVDTLVLLKEDNIAPLNWPVGRIVAVHPGRDGNVRALDIKTARGFVVRTSVLKVCPLPIDYS